MFIIGKQRNFTTTKMSDFTVLAESEVVDTPGE